MKSYFNQIEADRVKYVLTDLIAVAKDAINDIESIQDDLIIKSVFISPIFNMVLKSYHFQLSNLKIIITRYNQRIARKKG